VTTEELDALVLRIEDALVAVAGDSRRGVIRTNRSR
jgi:hypothetical protein